MDRAILLANLNVAGHPELGVKVREASTPADLQNLIQSSITAALAGGEHFAMVQGFELAGGGGGASWRAMVTLGRNLGWGMLTSIPAAVARINLRVARHFSEIETVIAQMYAAIAAATTHGGAVVWQPRITASGRDGTYLVGIVWADGNPGSLVLNQEFFSELGPVDAATTVLFLTVPQTCTATTDTEQNWRISWGALLNDVAGTGVKLRLLVDGVNTWESEQIGTAAQWLPSGGQMNHLQSATGNTLFTLILEPTIGGNQVKARGIYLRAEIANYPNNPT